MIRPIDLNYDDMLLHMKIRQFGMAIEDAKEGFERWNAIRAFYDVANPVILNADPRQWAIDPYAVNWTRFFTPIEFGLWQDIRSLGAVLYPQYPVGRYFVDFCNPVMGVAFECDGAAFHQDKEKDRKRDQEIAKHGITVYRLTGRECLVPDEEQNDDGEAIPVDSYARQMICSVVLGRNPHTPY